MDKMNETKALAVIPRSMSEIQSMAEVLAKSTLLPEALRNKVPDVVVQIMAGAELGLAPMASIRGVHIVQGKPVLAADTMVALVLSSGLCEYFSCIEETDTKVTYETKRKGSPHPQRVTWSDDDTKLASLQTKDNWRAHKKQMRRARAKAILARDVFPDVLAGTFDPDELHVPAVDLPPLREDVEDAEFTEAPANPPEFAEIDSAATEEDLKALAPKLSKLGDRWKQRAAEIYKDKLAWLRQQEPAA